MGNDGGSIPKRRELVKEAARNPTTTQLKESISEKQTHHWSYDPLSSRPLARPVVSDSLGRLFNKDSIIEFLLPADDEARRAEQEDLLAGTVKSLKDVVEVKFEIEADENGPRTGSGRTERWVCPITRQELGPAAKAVYLVPCGHVFAGAAIKEISGERCLQCEEPYASNDIIPILPTSEIDIARLQLRMTTLKEKGLAHSLKKVKAEKTKGDKKRKKTDVEAVITEVPDETALEPTTKAQLNDTVARTRSEVSTPQPGSGTSTPKISNGIKNAATASLTARVLEEQEERNKRRKMESNKNINSLYTSSKTGSDNKKPRDIDFMNRGFDIPSRR